MNLILRAVLLVILVTLLSACATTYRPATTGGLAAAPQVEPLDQNRMLIWRAWLSLEVTSLSSAVSQISALAKASGGYVEATVDSGDARADLTLRVPASSLNTTMASLESFGKVVSRRVSSDDVTEQYVDIDARLQTMIALRDRLRILLDQAQDVSDVLAIERELSRVQADIDAMQARLKTLNGQVELATINVSIKRKRILGPLGYIWNGVWWTIEKLFVIQD
ncbi:MAG: DUF4349 domain-containing protein [Marinobacter sp.]|nr:DUF4349 domain-containing protein [Marinobacter sp.]